MDACELLLDQIIERQTARDPRRPGVVSDGRILTYGELDAWADAVASELQHRGIAAEARVAICLGRSAELVVALLATLKAGAAYVPVDPAYPRSRRAATRATAAPALAICEAADDEGVEEWGDVLDIARLRALKNVEPNLDRDTRARPADTLAAAIYTSGSTGRPKGVMITHRSLATLALDKRLATLGADDVLLQLAPPAFIASTFEIFTTLAAGATLVIDCPTRPTVHQIQEAVQSHGVTAIHLTGPLLSLIGDADPDALRTVRVLMTGGDVVSGASVARARAVLPANARIVACFGTTETGSICLMHEPGPMAMTSDDDGVPLGRELTGVTARILDQRLRECSAGEVGELHLSGPRVGRGYAQHPALTASRFVPDPWTAESGARMYRTGDLVVRDKDGAMRFAGRLDRQVKVRGFLVMPEDLERTLRADPRVGDAVAATGRDSHGDGWLSVTVVPTAKCELSADDVRVIAAAHLPEYLVPTRIVIRAELSPSYAGKRAASPVTPTPWTDIVITLWREALDLDKVALDDDFIRVGGHSVAATRIAARLHGAHGVEVGVAAVLAHPTPAALAAHIETLVQDGC